MRGERFGVRGLGCGVRFSGFWIVGFRVRGLVCGVRGSGFGVWGSGFGVWGLEFHGWRAGFGGWCWEFGVWSVGLGLGVSGWGLKLGLGEGFLDNRLGIWGLGVGVSAFKFRVLGSGFIHLVSRDDRHRELPLLIVNRLRERLRFRVSGFQCRIDSFGLRVSGFGLRVSEFVFRGLRQELTTPREGCRVPAFGLRGLSLFHLGFGFY